MRRYGSDKPDLRVKLQFTDLTAVMKDVDFKVFAGAANMEGGRVVGLRVPGGGAMPRSEIDAYTQFVAIYGAKGLAYIKVNEKAKGRDGLQSPDRQEPARRARWRGIVEQTGAEDGDLIFFGADQAKVVNDALGALRAEDRPFRIRPQGRPVRRRLEAAVGRSTSRCSNTTSEAQRWSAAPPSVHGAEDGHEDYLETDPGRCIAKAYDMVLNGWELGGGSVRIHRDDVQSKVFRALNINDEEAQLEVRLPARRPAIRRAAARRHRLRPRPHRHHDGRRRHRSAT